MECNSVVISGMGAVSAAGDGVMQSLHSMLAGERNIGTVTLFDTDLDLPVFEASSFSDEQQTVGERTLRLLQHAVKEALADAELSVLTRVRVGLCFGTTVACQLNNLRFYATYRSESQAPMDAVDRYLHGNLADAVAEMLGSKGPAMVVANACSSGTDAIGVAMSWLNAGLCDIAIAGGSDELSRFSLCGFNALGVAGSAACAPFDANRKGLNLGEGAGVMVLETHESAKKRGISSRLRVCGYGVSADAHHLTAPHPEGDGLIRAVNTALDMAGIGADRIEFINAHGTSTHDNDVVEGKVVRKLFGVDTKVLSTKGYTGHTLGAAGGLEAVFCAASLTAGWIPASAGFKTLDEEIGIIPVSENTELLGNYALSTSLAFGGNNAALVVGME